MNKQTFELRQQWAKANLENCKIEKENYELKIRLYTDLLEHVKKDIIRYEEILKEEL